MMPINLPQQISDLVKEDLETIDCLVFVGANGSGKTRLAEWIVKHNIDNIYKITAHKNLNINTFIMKVHPNQAKDFMKKRFVSTSERNLVPSGQLGDSDRVIALACDYDRVLANLLAQEDQYKNRYIEDQKHNNNNSQISFHEFPIAIVTKVFNSVRFPDQDKKISYNFNDGSFEIIDINQTNQYHVRTMSDGERAILYYIAYCISIEGATIIIVDEPELYLHKSIVKKLWHEIKTHCPNKQFIYLTHDLDFASSITNAKTIWIKEYSKNNNQDIWEVEGIEKYDNIPEQMMLTILGSRQNILFVEAENDRILYQELYKDFFVIAVSSCSQVINLTKAFNNDVAKKLHNKRVVGLIDKDYHSNEKLQELAQNYIYSIKLHELENLYYSEEIIKAIISDNSTGKVDDNFTDIKEKLFKEFEIYQNNIVDDYINQVCRYKLKQKINQIKFTENKDNFNSIMQNLINPVDIKRDILSKINHIAENRNFNELLGIIEGKHIANIVARLVGFSGSKAYIDCVNRKIQTGKIDVTTIKQFLPSELEL